MPRPRRAATALLQAACVHARALAACPRKHAMALAACLGLDCQPMGAAMALALAACTQACLGLGCLPMGAALALAAACPGLGWLHARGGAALALAFLGLCCLPTYLGSDFLKMRVFWKMRLFPPRRQAVGMPACTPCRIAPHRPALRKNWLVPFSIFVSLNSFHDFRGGFQQAVWRSERF
jgi:hypothetical protein